MNVSRAPESREGSCIERRPLLGRRILFLGAAYHPLSVACVAALARGGADVVVGADDPLRRELKATARRVLRSRGARALLYRVALVAVARVRLGVRRLGIQLTGAASLSEVCAMHGLMTIPVADPNARQFVEQVTDLRVEIIVIANFRHILRRPLRKASVYGTINVHPSLLPALRGPDPLYWALALRNTYTGVTIHVVDDGIDTGPVIAQERISILPGDNERSLLARCVPLAARLTCEAVVATLADQTVAQPQMTVGASYFGKAPRGASAW